MRYHVSRHSVKAALHRDQLAKALIDLPSNTQLLTLYIDHEAKAGLQSRIYSQIMEKTRKDASLAEVLWSIWAICRVSRNILDSDSGGNSRVRAVLTKAVTSNRCEISVLAVE